MRTLATKHGSAPQRSPDSDLMLASICEAPNSYALFLDIDGTLIDIAPVPELVCVPQGMVDCLHSINAQLGGAVAILTGRTIERADQILAPLRLIASGVHGAELRSTVDGPILNFGSPLDERLVHAIEVIAGKVGGVHVEQKSLGLTVHYRSAPGAGKRLEQELRDLLSASGSNSLHVSHGRMALEVGLRAVSKATALEGLVRRAPFSGRRPVMIGDDVGDAPALSAAERLGGRGLSVAGEHFSKESATFSGPDAVRQWLSELSRRLV